MLVIEATLLNNEGGERAVERVDAEDLPEGRSLIMMTLLSMVQTSSAPQFVQATVVSRKAGRSLDELWKMMTEALQKLFWLSYSLCDHSKLIAPIHLISFTS